MNKTIELLQRTIFRSFYYFKQGYMIITLPFSFISWATTVYYLAIRNIPSMEGIFPHFSKFMLLGVLVIVPLCIAVGGLFIKGRFYRETFEINREVNPYLFKKIPPVSIPFYESWIDYMKTQNIDVTALEIIVGASKLK